MNSIDNPIFLTQSYSAALKCRLKYAEKGRSLLKKRSDGLMMKFRSICGQIIDNKAKLEDIMRTASISLAEVKFTGGNVEQTVIEGVERARVRVLTKAELIGGLKVIKFQLLENNENTYEFAGLARGGQQVLASCFNPQSVLKLKENYHKAILHLVELASLQQAFIILEMAIKKTNLRINALRHTVIPKLESTLSYLTWELDEQEREQFYRLKKMCKKKEKVKTKNQCDPETTLRVAYDDHDDDLLF